MELAWSQSLSVGVPKIDDEHKNLINEINDLLAAMCDGRGQSQIEPLLAFLASHVQTHFQGEEEIMRQHGYPGLEAHAAEHAAFVKAVMALQAEFRATGPSSALVVSLAHLLCDGLREHMAQTDAKLGKFLQPRA